MAVFRARCVYSGAVVVLKGYSRESLTPQTKERIWNEVQTLQVRVLRGRNCGWGVRCYGMLVAGERSRVGLGAGLHFGCSRETQREAAPLQHGSPSLTSQVKDTVR